MSEPVLRVAEFNALPDDEATELLRACCASSAWLAEVVGGRPYASLAELTTRSDEAVAELDWPGITEALAAHPRIGQRAAGADRESAWSRQEQSGAAASSADVTEQLRAGNVAYEDRFGYVFLICATGRSSEQMLAALHERLGNDDDAEHEVVRGELRDIVRLRLAKSLQ